MKNILNMIVTLVTSYYIQCLKNNLNFLKCCLWSGNRNLDQNNEQLQEPNRVLEEHETETEERLEGTQN